jgi:hypothetical protein
MKIKGDSTTGHGAMSKGYAENQNELFLELELSVVFVCIQNSCSCVNTRDISDKTFLLVLLLACSARFDGQDKKER